MKLQILDASIAVKWLVEEPHSELANQFLAPNCIRLAPDFIVNECLSAVHNKVRLQEISELDGWNTFSHFKENMPILLFPSDCFCQTTYRMANEIKHSIYDCFYLALAEWFSTILITADRKFHNRVQTSPYANLIHWIEDPIVS